MKLLPAILLLCLSLNAQTTYGPTTYGPVAVWLRVTNPPALFIEVACQGDNPVWSAPVSWQPVTGISNYIIRYSTDMANWTQTNIPANRTVDSPDQIEGTNGKPVRIWFPPQPVWLHYGISIAQPPLIIQTNNYGTNVVPGGPTVP